jgi:L-seryl-tRNA(Ser) seleniumtransferase
MGYDLIAFSGGKAIRGPQCAGLLVGRANLVAYALLNNSPHEDTIGRSQKVGKEEIIGMIKALELYLADDHDALAQEWQRRLELISRKLTTLPGVTTSYFVPDVANHVPHMEIKWDAQRIKLSPDDALSTLRKSRPSIVLARAEKHGEKRDGVALNSFMLQPGEDAVIADGLYDLLKAHSA